MENGDKVFKLIQDALTRIEGKVDRIAHLPALVAWLYVIMATVVAGLVVSFMRGN